MSDIKVNIIKCYFTMTSELLYIVEQIGLKFGKLISYSNVRKKRHIHTIKPKNFIFAMAKNFKAV